MNTIYFSISTVERLLLTAGQLLLVLVDHHLPVLAHSIGAGALTNEGQHVREGLVIQSSVVTNASEINAQRIINTASAKQLTRKSKTKIAYINIFK